MTGIRNSSIYNHLCRRYSLQRYSGCKSWTWVKMEKLPALWFTTLPWSKWLKNKYIYSIYIFGYIYISKVHLCLGLSHFRIQRSLDGKVCLKIASYKCITNKQGPHVITCSSDTEQGAMPGKASIGAAGCAQPMEVQGHRGAQWHLLLFFLLLPTAHHLSQQLKISAGIRALLSKRWSISPSKLSLQLIHLKLQWLT